MLYLNNPTRRIFAKTKIMGFSQFVKEKILVKSARHCCVCHKPKGINLEVHNINSQQQVGDDSIVSAICLCFDCHSDAGH
jgi:hypothetical protein